MPGMAAVASSAEATSPCGHHHDVTGQRIGGDGGERYLGLLDPIDPQPLVDDHLQPLRRNQVVTQADEPRDGPGQLEPEDVFPAEVAPGGLEFLAPVDARMGRIEGSVERADGRPGEQSGSMPASTKARMPPACMAPKLPPPERANATFIPYHLICCAPGRG